MAVVLIQFQTQSLVPSLDGLHTMQYHHFPLSLRSHRKYFIPNGYLNMICKLDVACSYLTVTAGSFVRLLPRSGPNTLFCPFCAQISHLSMHGTSVLVYNRISIYLSNIIMYSCCSFGNDLIIFYLLLDLLSLLRLLTRTRSS